LVPLLPAKKIVGWRWVYGIKVGPNREVDCLTDTLVAKGYTQIYIEMEKTVGCRWVYAIKVGLNGEVNRLKA
jgi:hypothetical protein